MLKIPSHIRKLYPNQSEDKIVAMFLSKCGNRCFLCEGNISPNDDLVLDHDIPTSAGGDSDPVNLNACHRECNAFKRDAHTLDVRPFLKMRRRMREMKTRPKYSDCVSLLGVDPGVVRIFRKDGRLTFEFPDGDIQEVGVFEDPVHGSAFGVEYCYVALPREAIHNDDIQPRSIKDGHLWQIYLDLHLNPLYEAPGCRLDPSLDDSTEFYRIRMFDGQHKTLASWLLGREHVVCKVFLRFSDSETIQLVNSIQSKIVKLPLSPFEFTAKMAAEWRDKFDRYCSQVGFEPASEDGFLRWLGASERRRGKQALQSAVVDGVVGHPELLWQERIVSGQEGGTRKGDVVTEASFKRRVVERLVDMTALKDVGSSGREKREREQENVVRVLNLVYRVLFSPPDEHPLTEWELERARRAMYQASMSLWAGRIRRCVATVCKADADETVFQNVISDDQWREIEECIVRLFDHWLWKRDFDDSEWMKRLENALQKNQDLEELAKEAGLNNGYIVGADEQSAPL